MANNFNDKTSGKSGDFGGGAGSTDKQKPMTGGTTGSTRTTGTDKSKMPNQGTDQSSKK